MLKNAVQLEGFRIGNLLSHKRTQIERNGKKINY